MLGGSCSQCCSCDDEAADELNAAVKKMNVSCKITQTGYIPQTGLVACTTNAVAATNWATSTTLSASLASAGALVPDSLGDFNPPASVFHSEDQIDADEYPLSLQVSSLSPRFIYQDQHIEIQFLFRFLPFRAGVIIDGSGCGVQWGLVVRKKRFATSGGGRLNDYTSIPISRYEYGPDAASPNLSGAAVARWLAFDYGVAEDQANQINAGFNVRSFLFNQFWSVTSLPLFPDSGLHYAMIYDTADAPVTSVSGSLDSGISLDFASQTRGNNAYSLHDRFNVAEPEIVSDPTYSVDRPVPGYIRFRQDSSPVLPQSIGQAGTPFSASAFVELLP